VPAYVWKGKTRDGKVVSGERVADNKEAVMQLLRRDQILVSSVKEKGRELALPKLGGGVPSKDLAIFTRQFSVMIDAGLPLVQCLEILGSQQENKTFAKILQQTRMDVEGGASLADAMRKHPKAFDDLFTNMIAAGEAGGILDTILKRLGIDIVYYGNRSQLEYDFVLAPGADLATTTSSLGIGVRGRTAGRTAVASPPPSTITPHREGWTPARISTTWRQPTAAGPGRNTTRTLCWDISPAKTAIPK
jgi:hypothetical protein